MLNIRICARREAEENVKEMNATHVLSLVDSNTPLPTHTCEHKVLRFIDTIHQVSDGPTLDIVQEILNFGKTLTEKDRIVIHCEAGISRSTAAALLILVQHTGDINASAEMIKYLRKQASPNMLMIYFGELILNKPDQILPKAREISDFVLLIGEVDD